MNKLKWVWDNLDLTRDEASRFIFLFVLIGIIVLGKLYFVFLYDPVFESPNLDLLADEALPTDTIALSQIVPFQKENSDTPATKPNNSSPSKNTYKPTQKKKFPTDKKQTKSKQTPLFHFDPNTISRDSLEMLDFPSYAINGLLKYRSKGGKVRTPEQLLKLNGIDSSTYNRLLPFVDIKLKANPSYKKKKWTPIIVDINDADTTMYQKLYGIGPAYARMIVNYRSKLGGFNSIEQIAETYGIPDSVFQKIKPYLKLESSYSKFDINLADEESLSMHPYLRWNEAKGIIAYRKKHGPFSHIDDLYKLYALTEEKVDTIKMYFEVK